MADVRGLVLGELAVKEKILTEDDLDVCVQQQIDERYKRPLGEIMVAKGYIDQEGLDDLLRRQKEVITEYERTAETAQLFGRIAVAQRFITEEQLASAIRAQIRKESRGQGAKIGQVMIEMELIDIQQFWSILHAQGDFTCAACAQVLERPFFRGETVLCEYCKSPAFTVTPEKPGPRPTGRRKRR